MRCPFCAENIQDAAVVCRFCGAARTAGGEWVPSTRPAARRKGSLTIKSSGALFLISGAVSLASLTSDAALFGAVRSGTVAVCYNLIFALLFLGVGFGLILGRIWGYRLLLAGTIIYSLDRLAFLLSKNTRDAYLTASGVTGEVGSIVDMKIFDQAFVLSTLGSVLCWWGLAVYIYWRRDYFRASSSVDAITIARIR